MKKYALHPGYIVSRTDGQRHYVGYVRLVELYRLPASKCVNVVDLIGPLRWNGLIHLHPRPNGDYKAFAELLNKRREQMTKRPSLPLTRLGEQLRYHFEPVIYEPYTPRIQAALDAIQKQQA